MPREYMPYYASTWNDPQWRDLTVAQQQAYSMIGSQGNISACGVLDVPLRRLTKLAADLTVESLQQQIDVLARRRFLVVDDTGEILVRSYIRHDGLLKMGTRPAKQIARHWHMIDSRTISRAVVTELRRLYREDPKLPGWAGIRDEDADLFDQIEASESPAIRAIS